MTFIKRIQCTYSTILRAKIYFFLKKSLWMYLIGVIMIAYVIPIASIGIFLSALIYFTLLLVMLIPLYHFSTKMIAARNNLDADIEFNEQSIIIRHRNKTASEVKEWTWVKKLDITNHGVFLVTDTPYRFIISFNQNELSEEELQFFQKKKDHI